MAQVTDPGLSGEESLVEDTWLVLPSSPRSVALARRYAIEMCSSMGWSGSTDTVELLVSEVTTNATQHTGSTHVRVRVLEHGRRLRVEVSDGSPALPVPRGARPSDESGRGLALVEELASAWGADTRPDGKTAWFEIDA